MLRLLMMFNVSIYIAFAYKFWVIVLREYWIAKPASSGLCGAGQGSSSALHAWQQTRHIWSCLGCFRHWTARVWCPARSASLRALWDVLWPRSPELLVCVSCSRAVGGCWTRRLLQAARLREQTRACPERPRQCRAPHGGSSDTRAHSLCAYGKQEGG